MVFKMFFIIDFNVPFLSCSHDQCRIGSVKSQLVHINCLENQPGVLLSGWNH